MKFDYGPMKAHELLAQRSGELGGLDTNLDEEGNPMESCPHSKQHLWIDLGIELDEYDILRREEPQG